MQAKLPILTGLGVAGARLERRVADMIYTSCREVSLGIGGPSLRSLAVTSAIRREGRTSVALAMALVHVREYGRRVVLVDMDGFDRPSLADVFGIEHATGLGEYFTTHCPLSEIRHSVLPGLTLIPSGAQANGILRLLRQGLASGFLGQIQEGQDVVIADLPPLLDGPFSRLAVREFERTLVVIRASGTRIEQLRDAVGSLPVEPALLLNGAASKVPAWLRRLRGA